GDLAKRWGPTADPGLDTPLPWRTQQSRTASVEFVDVPRRIRRGTGAFDEGHRKRGERRRGLVQRYHRSPAVPSRPYLGGLRVHRHEAEVQVTSYEITAPVVEHEQETARQPREPRFGAQAGVEVVDHRAQVGTSPRP